MPNFVYVIIACGVPAIFALFFIVSFVVRAIVKKVNKKSNKYAGFEGALKVSNSDDDFGLVLEKAMSTDGYNEYHIL